MQRRRLRPSSVAVLRSVLTCAIGTVSLVALLAVHVSPSSSPFPAAYTLPKVSPLLLPLFASLGHSTFDSGMTPTRRRRRNRRSCGSLHQTMVVSCLALNPPHRIHVT
ncbi:hypothetical protein B296_00053065 [Ensete ventricosum]|uniref:Uncharacterized protein n=1 Tax=Ensete ventricosum TaxID=4639 RepID=A0A426Y9T0_ENSVE|nr:hypothetical protein B296_00053065 [Ensete ventricosum]